VKQYQTLHTYPAREGNNYDISLFVKIIVDDNICELPRRTNSKPNTTLSSIAFGRAKTEITRILKHPY
jgi:hypothetical protein